MKSASKHKSPRNSNKKDRLDKSGQQAPISLSQEASSGESDFGSRIRK